MSWTLYALSQRPEAQAKLRDEIHSLALTVPPPPSSSPSSPPPSSPSLEEPSESVPEAAEEEDTAPDPPSQADLDRILKLPYLDACVRESLRLHAPVTSTMRVAARADVVPVLRPFLDRRGRWCDYIRINKGDIVTVPMQAVNTSVDVWGEDAEAYVPERWLGENGDGEGSGGGVGNALRGLWGGILTFGSGSVVNGNRSCIGYRFAVNE